MTPASDFAAAWQVQRAVVAFARGLDRADERTIVDCLHEDAAVARVEGDDVRSLSGPTTARELVASTRLLSGTFLSHRVLNPVVVVRGDLASCESQSVSLTATTGEPDAVQEFGRVLDLLALRDGRWRIVDRRVIVTWRQPLLPGGTWRRPEESRRDRKDASFDLFEEVLASSADAGDEVDRAVAGWQIYQAAIGYCRGVDRADEELIESVFHPDATVTKAWGGTEPDMVDIPGPLVAASSARRSSAAFVGGLVAHGLSNPLVEVSGDRAALEIYSAATIAPWDLGDGRRVVHEGYSRCLDLFERRDERWKVLRRQEIGGWSQPLPEGGLRFDEGVSTQDHDDPSYRILDELPPVTHGGSAAEADAVDGWEIYQVLLRYARGVDRADPDLIAATFHPDAVVTTRIWGTEQITLSGPEIVTFLSERAADAGHVGSQHLITNPFVDLRGDVAVCETHYTVLVVPVDHSVDRPLELSHGRCIDVLERRRGIWRILRRLSISGWHQPQPLGGRWLDRESRRDRDDPSYRIFPDARREWSPQ